MLAIRLRKSHKLLQFVGLALSIVLWARTPLAQTENGNWRSYGGDQASTKYAPLNQIHKGNVDSLDIAWRWQSIDQPILLLAGDKDPQLTVEEAQSLHQAATNPNSQLEVFSNTGHIVFTKDNPKIYAEVVFGFLERIFQSGREKALEIEREN